MSASDGYVVGTTKVVDHGPDSARWNLVIIGTDTGRAKSRNITRTCRTFWQRSVRRLRMTNSSAVLTCIALMWFQPIAALTILVVQVGRR